jgi:hypothetical protein
MNGIDGYFGGAFGTAGGDSGRNERGRNNKRKRGRGQRRMHGGGGVGSGEGGGGEDDHRARALAKQAWHAIELELGALSRGADWNIRVVHVDAVGGGPLTIFVMWDSARAHVGEVLEWLGRVRGQLRTAVASSITRKRVPDLQFVPAMGFAINAEPADSDSSENDGVSEGEFDWPDGFDPRGEVQQ